MALALAMVAITWGVRITPPAGHLQDDIHGNSDLYTEFYPMFEANASRLRSGHLFLWNPDQLCGLPGLATLVLGAFYPPHLLYVFATIPSGMRILAFVHLSLGVGFALLLGRALSLTWLGALVVGLSFGLSSITVANFLWPNIFETIVWLPLGIAAIVRIMCGGGRRWAVALSVAVAMSILAGGYQHTVYNLYAFLLCSICGGVARVLSERRLQSLLPVALTIAVSVAAGVAVAAPQLLPTLELTGHATRSTHALRPDQILPFGKVFTWSSVLSGAVVPEDNFLSPYVGAVPIILAAAGLACRPSVAVLFPALLVAWGLLGMVTPDWFLHAQAWVPALAWFRFPSRAKSLGVLGIAMLAGMGLDTLRQFGGSSRWRRGMWSALLIAGGVASAIMRYPHPSWLIPAGLAALGAVAYLAVAAWAHVAVSILVLALCGADLLAPGPNRNNLPWVRENWRRVREYSVVWTDTLRRAGLSRILHVPAGANFSWSTKSATFEAAYSPIDYDPLVLSRYGDFFEYAASGRPWPKDGSGPFVGNLPPGFWDSSPGRVRRFLSLLSVRYLLLAGPALFDQNIVRFAQTPAVATVHTWVDKASTPQFLLLENRDALPRAYAVYRGECITDPVEQLARLASPTFNPREAVVLEGKCVAEDGPPGVAPEARIETYQDTLVRVSVDLPHVGFLVLTDSYYPGWQASVNGNPEAIFRANTVLRAVRVPAGHSDVQFRYVPRSLYVGAGIALTTLALVLVVWERHGWRAFRGR